MSREMNSKIRVLVVGLGNMGLSHAQAYAGNPGFEIVGLANRSEVALPPALQSYPRFGSFDVGSLARIGYAGMTMTDTLSRACMEQLRPDLFVHVGDTIYGDEPMDSSVRLDDGTTWVNDLTEDVTTVAETLGQFRGRHRYVLRDENVRAFHAAVPTVST